MNGAAFAGAVFDVVAGCCCRVGAEGGLQVRIGGEVSFGVEGYAAAVSVPPCSDTLSPRTILALFRIYFTEM